MKTFFLYLTFIFLTLACSCKPQSQTEISPSVESNAISKAGNLLYVNSKGGLRMREEANTESKIVILIPNGSQVEELESSSETVEINGKSGRWTKVKFDGNEGWVFGAFLTDVAKFDLLPETFDPITINVNYGNGVNSGKIILEQGKIAHGKINEYHGCDYTIESGKWSLDEENQSILVDTKGKIADSCLTGPKPFSQKYILKLTKTLDKTPDSIDCTDSSVVECTLK